MFFADKVRSVIRDHVGTLQAHAEAEKIMEMAKIGLGLFVLTIAVGARIKSATAQVVDSRPRK
jgi:hypothetical protein